VPAVPPLDLVAPLPAVAAVTAEDALLEQVVSLCRQFGLYHYHSHDSRRDAMAGFPDLVIVGHKILYRELKSRTGELEPDQKRWMRRLVHAGADWELWRPADYASGLVLAQLTAIS
jgi:hypothetical protein